MSSNSPQLNVSGFFKTDVCSLVRLANVNRDVRSFTLSSTKVITNISVPNDHREQTAR